MMAADPLDEYIDAVSKALAMPVEDAWKPAVKANLEVSLRLARLNVQFLFPRRTKDIADAQALPGTKNRASASVTIKGASPAMLTVASTLA